MSIPQSKLFALVAMAFFFVASCTSGVTEGTADTGTGLDAADSTGGIDGTDSLDTVGLGPDGQDESGGPDLTDSSEPPDVAMICEPGVARCDGTAVVQCATDGLAETVIEDCAAADKNCASGVCVAKVCKAGEVKCSGDALDTCSADGMTWNSVACSDDDPCTDDTCENGKCNAAANAATCTLGEGCGTPGHCTDAGCIPDTPKVATLAGQSTPGSQDGEPDEAKFTSVVAAAWAKDGTLWVVDEGARRVRRIATTDGTVTTVAGADGTKLVDGPALQAVFLAPAGIAFDAAGVAYVSDSAAHVVRRIAAGVVSTYAGIGVAGILDGPAGSAAFHSPRALAMDAKGNLYVSDPGVHAIRRISAAGMVTTVAGGKPGYVDGAATEALFKSPGGITVDPAGNLFVADTGNQRIRKIGIDGTVTTVAGAGTAGFNDGPASSALFSQPCGLAPDGQGGLYVGDSGNLRIRHLSASENVKTVAGSGTKGGTDGATTSASFYAPNGIVWVPGALVVADQLKVRQITGVATNCDDGKACTMDKCDGPTGECSHTATPAGSACEDGNACTQQDACDLAGSCSGVEKTCDDGSPCTVDTCNPYLGECAHDPVPVACDDGNPCTQTDWCAAGKCVTGQHVVTTVAGSEQAGTIDGVGASARLTTPHGLAVAPNGDVYFSGGDHRIRKLSADGVITTVAGKATYGNTNGPALQAAFNVPTRLAFDAGGNLFIADEGNHCIRLLTEAGMVSTIAGACKGGTGFKDGAAASALFNTITGLAVDSEERLFVLDANNYRIRMVADGVVSTFAGADEQKLLDGKGANARLFSAWGLAVDSQDRLWFSDWGHIRRADPDGTVTTIAGGDKEFVDGPLEAARFTFVLGVAIGPDASLIVVDDQRLRIMSKAGTVTTWAGNGSTAYMPGPGLLTGLPQQAISAVPWKNGLILIAAGNLLLQASALAVACDDGVDCTQDGCNADTLGCTHVPEPVGTACDDGSECTLGETCSGAKCTGGQPNACNDADPCTLDACGKWGCTHLSSDDAGCCKSEVLSIMFDDGTLEGFTTTPQGPFGVGWKLASNLSHSAPGALYYGNGINYQTGDQPNSGTATSPAFWVPDAGTALEFWVWPDIEGPTLEYDLLFVEVGSDADWSVVWKKDAVAQWKGWSKQTVELAAWAGRKVQVRFRFDSVDTNYNLTTGVHVDDVRVVRACP